MGLTLPLAGAFLLTSQLLQGLLAACRAHRRIGYEATSVLCALISTSNYSLYFLKHDFVSRDLRFISICSASERVKRKKTSFSPNVFSDKHFSACVCNPFSPRL